MRKTGTGGYKRPGLETEHRLEIGRQQTMTFSARFGLESPPAGKPRNSRQLRATVSCAQVGNSSGRWRAPALLGRHLVTSNVASGCHISVHGVEVVATNLSCV